MKKAKQKKLNNKIHVIPSERSKQFIENFNKNKPTEEFIESCKKARELFGGENDKSTDQNVADVPSGDFISRQWLLDLYEIDTTDFKETAKVPLEVIIQNIKDAPSVSIQPKTIANDCDLISRADAIEAICNAQCELDVPHYPQCDQVKWCDEVKALLALPSADRPKGEWIRVTNGRGGHECSNCHAYAPSYMSGDEYLSDFCPCCGARMKGGDTE